MSLINFLTASEIEKNRHYERGIRENILSKAKQKYENELQREKKAKEKGETTWMLQAVEDKLDSVKNKKKKKSKKKRHSSSSENEDKDAQTAIWIEKSAQLAEPLKREEWMEMTALFKTRTREQMKIADGSSRALKKLEERKHKEEANKPGTHPRELNPFYKDGGTGLPSLRGSSVPVEESIAACSSSYDASWLRKALQRAKDKATEKGCSLEEIAQERWGSLDTFYKLLHEAEGNLESHEKAQKMPVWREKSRRRERRSRSWGRSTKSEEENDRRMREGRTRSRERNENRDNVSSGSSERENKDCTQSRSRDPRKSHAKKRRKRHSGSSGRSCSVSPKRECNSRSLHKEGKNTEFASRKSRMEGQGSGSTRKSSSKGFLRPDDMETRFNTRLGISYSSFGTSCSSRNSSSWRKKVHETSQAGADSKSLSSHNHSSRKTSGSEEETESRREQEQKQAEIDLPNKTVSLLTDKEMNQLAAKLTKAELLGTEVQVAKLKSKLEAARTAREQHQKNVVEDGLNEEEEEKEVILTMTNKRGFTRPVSVTEEEDSLKGKKKRKNKVEVFDADGKRASYFADDFKVDLQSMFEKEKMTSAVDQIAALENLSCANVEKLSDDFNVDDMFISKVAPKESGIREKERERLRAIWEHQRMQKTLDSCHFCIGNKLMKKHLIVSLGTSCYLSLPAHQSLTEGHCLIVPLHHVTCGTQADEDLWQEVTNFRQSLVRAFSSTDTDCVFFESATQLHQTPHMVMHCVPLPKESGELAPIYFKKAIMECDEEWAQNKKLIELKGRNVRQAVPKELPYFFVDFGMTPGFAHVVENDRLFPNNFAQEIIGGMIDADISLFRKPKLENFDVQRKKVLKFAKFFEPFDPTLSHSM